MRLIFSLAFLLGTLVMSASSQAAIVFTLSPANQSVNAGTPLVFNLFVKSDTVATTIDALDVNVVAGAGDGTGGVFTSGTTTLLGSDPFDVLTNPGQAFSTNFQAGGTSIGTTDVLYGVLTLDTTGVAGGNYTITLDSLNANDPVNGSIATSGVGAAYSITAVPEPTSMALVGLIGGVVGFRRWRKMAAKA
jgi:hypothetical protein